MDSQPQEAAGVTGAVFAWAAGSHAETARGSIPAVISGVVTSNIGGRAIYCAGGSNSAALTRAAFAADVFSAIFGSGKPGTIIFQLRGIAVTGGLGVLMSLGRPSLSKCLFYIQGSTGGNFIFASHAGAFTSCSWAGAAIDNTLRTVAITHDGVSSARLVHGGIDYGTQTFSATNFPALIAGESLNIGAGNVSGASDNFWGATADFLGFVALPSALPSSRLVELTSAPGAFWQLFEPQRVYIPPAAGGAGAQTLTPSLYSDAQSFFSPTVSVGAVSLAPSLFTGGQTFYAPTVAGGAVALSPSLLTNAQTFYAPTVTQAGQALSPSLYSNSQSFYAPTVTVGAVDLTPELFTSASSFFVPYVSDGTASGFVRYFDVLSGRLLILKPLGAVAAASGATWTEVEVDFGSSPVYGAEFTITDAAITAASKVQVLPCGKAATGRTADDWAWDGASFAANPGAGSATCYAQFLPGPIVGKRKVQYSVGA